MKKKIVPILLVAMMFIMLSACKGNDTAETTVATSATESEATTTAEETITPADTTVANSTAAATTVTPTTETTEETVEIAVERGEISGASDKDISGINVVYSNSYRNDVTGKWRLAKISESIDITEYALSYYKTYFEDKDELHVIINFSNNTTTSMRYMGGILDISTYEYVKGEEHDAKEACSGDLLTQYWVYTDNGDIEKIS